MPGRFLIISIICFWLATTSWLFFRDLWPRLAPGEPPPFTVDLADEASDQKIYWAVLKDGANKGYAQTWVKYYSEDDTFEIAGVIKIWESPHKEGGPDLEMESQSRVTREGELRQITAHAKVKEIRVQVAGRVAKRRLFTRFDIITPVFPLKFDLPPVPVSHRGNILNPLLPVNRIQGLALGQGWRVPLVDPLEDALKSLTGGTLDVRFFDARVLPEFQILNRGLGKNDQCLVIEYKGEDRHAKTWVRESDGLVLRQEATLNGETLILQRE
ncbi:MAG TPA: hypothetical protein VGY77_01205 [Gemmataceae bacterium]|nr:hypothetical protein [Gemmataceae bacterium]